MLKYGSLFSGYGGLDLGVQSVLGGETAWFCEFDKAPSKILAHHWPDVPNLGDITKVDWTQVEPVDVLTGGSPCQDLSQAGKRAGMTEGTRSNLWVQMREAIAALRPRLIVWENVRGALSAEATSDLEPCPGCVGGPGDGRVVLRALGRVVGDLAELGYDARWYGLRAADVGAAHGRFRIFLFATPADAGGIGGLEAVEHDGSGAQAGDGAGVPDQSDRDVVRSGPERDAGFGVDRAATPADTDLVRLEGGSQPQPSGACDPTTRRRDAGAPPAADLTLLPTPVSDNSRGLPSSGTDYQSLPNAAISLPPTPRATDGAKGGPNQAGSSGDLMLPSAVQPNRWGDYAAAIACWEHVIGRPAPEPTELSTKGNPRLSPRFVEWLMGLPAGHVTDVPTDAHRQAKAAPRDRRRDAEKAITRNEQLKALGNGVVPQQAAAATRAFLEDTYQVPAGAPAVDVDGPLLPTPNVFHMGNTEQPDEWRRRRADVFKRTGTRHGPALPVVALSIEQGDPLTPDNYMPEEDD